MLAKLMIFVVASLLFADDKPKEAKKDQDAIQGAWKVESIERGGQKSTPPGVVLVMKGENYVVKENDQESEEGTFKLDSEKKPKTIDFKITKGNDKGKNQVGIYSIEGDTVRICVALPGQDDRPKEIAAKEGTDHIVFVMKRDKK